MRESTTEKKAKSYAESLGVRAMKFTSPANRARPDHIFVGPKGVIFIEFKAPGKKPTPLQYRERDLINKARTEPCAFWVDSFEAAKQHIDDLL